ncbi:hypothetical protein GCM10023188_43980 [Pontibacter saemangeumensis]|uniref:HTH cro/C1-type domain-containing protein n=1 Tax=Pontibacter saemangeumensis TaxID=1084525 RepID=A0ABP8M389_9BACT
MTDLNTFGGRLRAYRKSKKLKGEDFAAVLRVKKAQVAMIEHNASRTPAEKLTALATAFPDLDLNWLLTGKGEMLLDPGQEKLRALLQSAQEELGAAKQALQAARRELQTAEQELVSVKLALQSEQGELQSAKRELRSVKQALEKEQEKLQAVRERLDGERNKSEALEELLRKNRIAVPKHRGAGPGG